MRFGIILIVVGLLSLLSNLGILNDQTMAVVWPITLVVVGAWIMIRRRCMCDRSGCWGGRQCHTDCNHKGGVCKVEDSK